MQARARGFLFIAAFSLLLPEAASSAQQALPLDATKIGHAAGVMATTSEDGVVRISQPRADVAVSVSGVPLDPFAGLGSWAAFKHTTAGAMMMGDEVVFQDEVSPAMDAAFAAGLEVTALHNHFLFDEPKVYFMHIAGTGDPERLAAGVKSMWDAVRRVRAGNPQPALRFAGKTPTAGGLSAEPLDKILGHTSETRSGVVKVTIGRNGTMNGEAVGGSMGLTTWMAFTGNDALAVVDGDFIMTATEVQPILRALRNGDIHIVALHNHMIGDEPTFYFTHFWGQGPPEKLAHAIKAALDEQAKVRGGVGRH